MCYHLLASGSRQTFAYILFKPLTSTLELVQESPAPANASWIETPRRSLKGERETGERVVYGISEDKETAFCLGIGKDGKVKVLGEKSTGGNGAHVHCMRDGSGIVIANYLGGNIVFIPTDPLNGQFSCTSPSRILRFPYPFADRTPPNPQRQDECHLHQVIEGQGGRLYCSDLGADRIWVVRRKDGGEDLEVEGWLEVPEGSGPRHAVISHDGTHLYTIGEMSHEVYAFHLPQSPNYPLHPIPSFRPNIIPPTVPPRYQTLMDSSELLLHPVIPGVLFVSNRWELRISEREPNLTPLPGPRSIGDAVAILLLKNQGEVDQIKWVRTGCDVIRGMAVSEDGKYVAVAGQEGGGVEIWEIKGECGDEWVLRARNASVEGVKDFVWL